MNGLMSFLTLISWYKDVNPEEYQDIKYNIKDLIISLKSINEDLREFLSKENVDHSTIEKLYNALFKSPHESEVISAISEFLKYAEELEIFTKMELEEIKEILKDLQTLIALIANVYHTLKEGGRRKYVSLDELWKES